MDNKEQKKPTGPVRKEEGGKNFILVFLIILGLIYFMQWGTAVMEPVKELSYGAYFEMLKTSAPNQTVLSAIMTEDRINGKLKDGSRYLVHVPLQDQELMKELRTNVPDFRIEPPKTFMANLFWAILGPVVLAILFWMLMYRGAGGGGGGKVLSFGKSRARFASDEYLKVTFNDVAGVDEAKEELKEVIEFLKDPKRFQRLGGKMPKGILVMGPPGCGKTLLAKAVAGEAGVPFLSISGSDFVEMFVGVGASRVRDLFDQAKRSVKATKKGCIIFLDEIDAVGRQRFAGIGGGHDEREQTLNALLVEMDGFDTQEGVVLIAATNRPDVLDPALLRPGRFDRQIVVDRPDIKGRIDILNVHLKKIKLANDANVDRLAQQTPGFSGADLANLVNEAAILAARRNKEAVTMLELEESIERVMAGPQRKSRIISKEDKKVTAYHEAGHAILSLLVKHADPMHKVSIIPRGLALGYTLMPPEKDRHLYSKSQLLAMISVSLGGHAAEFLVFGEISTGAHDDLNKVAGIARSMVTQYGMSEDLGHLTYGKKHEQIFLGRDIVEEKNYSEETAKAIDKEVRKIVDECYALAKSTLGGARDKLDVLAEMLLEKEVLDDAAVKNILGIEIPAVNPAPAQGMSGI